MAVGFIPDFGSLASVLTTLFVEGTPEARTGLWERIQKGHGIKAWEAENAWAITAYRCTDCGKVELYANDRPDPNMTAPPRE